MGESDDSPKGQQLAGHVAGRRHRHDPHTPTGKFTYKGVEVQWSIRSPGDDSDFDTSLAQQRDGTPERVMLECAHEYAIARDPGMVRDSYG